MTRVNYSVSQLSTMGRVTGRILIAALAVVGVASIDASAQNRSYGYAFTGVAVESGDTYIPVGVGGEKIWREKIGLGIEGGGLVPTAGGSGGGIFSIRGSYHFPRGSRRIVPFVTGGIGGIGYEGGPTAGGGVNYWLGERVGLRFEAYHYFVERFPDVTSFRIGFTFR